MELIPQCSVLRDLRLERPVSDDYKRLFRFHYRAKRTGPVAGVWIFRQYTKSRINTLNPPVGLILYGYPSANLAARPAPLGGRVPLTELNRRLRTIRRVIIEPRWRGLGLATELVRKTLPLIGAEWVEASAVMGQACGFFEKAGMKACQSQPRREALALREALLDCRIHESLWWDSRAVCRRIETLDVPSRTALEKRIAAFLKPYKNRRAMPPGEERLRFVLSRLSARPVYYLWQNPEMACRQNPQAA